MKKNTYHIIYAWALLLCFVAGQYMVYAHQHSVNKHLHQTSLADSHNTSKHILKEKCEVCDSMHHTYMELVKQAYTLYCDQAKHIYISTQYNFESIGQILASGRAPPVVS